MALLRPWLSPCLAPFWRRPLRTPVPKHPSSMSSASAALEWPLRLILALACMIHSILDVTDPCTKAKSKALQVDDSIPGWLLPAVGVLRAVAAVALFSDDSLIVLGGLAYCSMLWCGAVYFHLSRKHHPAAVVPAGFFVLLVFAITALRYPFWMALVGQLACAMGAVALGWLLVTPADQRPGLLI